MVIIWGLNKDGEIATLHIITNMCTLTACHALVTSCSTEASFECGQETYLAASWLLENVQTS